MGNEKKWFVTLFFRCNLNSQEEWGKTEGNKRYAPRLFYFVQEYVLSLILDDHASAGFKVINLEKVDLGSDWATFIKGTMTSSKFDFLKL